MYMYWLIGFIEECSAVLSLPLIALSYFLPCCILFIPGYALFHNGANVSLVPTDGVFLMYDDEEEDNGQHSSSLTPAALSTATRSLSLAINVKALNAKDAQLKERQTVYREEEMQGHMLLSAFPEQVRSIDPSIDETAKREECFYSFIHSFVHQGVAMTSEPE